MAGPSESCRKHVLQRGQYCCLGFVYHTLNTLFFVYDLCLRDSCERFLLRYTVLQYLRGCLQVVWVWRLPRESELLHRQVDEIGTIFSLFQGYHVGSPKSRNQFSET